MKNKTLKRIERLLWSLVLAGAAVYILTGCEARVHVDSKSIERGPTETKQVDPRTTFKHGDRVFVRTGNKHFPNVATGIVLTAPNVFGQTRVLFIDTHGTPTEMVVPESILSHE